METAHQAAAWGGEHQPRILRRRAGDSARNALNDLLGDEGPQPGSRQRLLALLVPQHVLLDGPVLRWFERPAQNRFQLIACPRMHCARATGEAATIEPAA